MKFVLAAYAITLGALAAYALALAAERRRLRTEISREESNRG